MVKNVILDWSGTLVDDLPAVWQATNHVFRQSDLPEMTLEQFRAEFCLPFSNFYSRYLPDRELAELEILFHAAFAQAQETVTPLPHALDFLEYCRGRGWRLFLLSAVHPRMFSRQAGPHGLENFFERAYLGVADKRHQIHLVLEENQLDPAATVFIGDMEHDIETAHHGGIRSVAVLTGYQSLHQLRSAGPDLIVEHLGELEAVLERNEGQLPIVTGRKRSATLEKRPVATVGALIQNDLGQWLMVRTHKWSDLWGIPGGKIEPGETSESALRREIREETGLEIDNIRFVLVQDAINPPEFYREAHFLLLNYTCEARTPIRVQLNEEAQEYRWVSSREARDLPLNTPTRILLDSVDPVSP
jgi:phosphoglycolate phosphatase